MEQYIPKSALVAEIEKRMLRYEQERKTEPAYYDGLYTALEDLRDDFINTLEVKEVDLQKDSLTWKDINLIDHLLFDIKEDYDNGKLDKEKYYKEVLKKFKAQL